MEPNDHLKKEKGSKKTLIRIILLSVILCAAYWAVSKYLYARHHEETDDAQLDAEIYPVSARVGGNVYEIRFEENQSVTAGDTLVVIDKRELLNKVSQATAGVAAAEAVSSVSRAAVATAAANLNTAKSAVDAASIRVWKAEREWSRISNLQQEGAGTVQQLDAAKAEKDAADAQLVSAKRQREAADASLQVAQEQVKTSTAAIASRQVELEYAQLQLSYSVVTAPVSGCAAKKNIQPGQLITSGTPLFAIVSDNDPYVVANFKETQIGPIQEGQAVEVKVDAFPGRLFFGKVASFSPATGAKFSLLPPDNATGNYVKVVQRIPVRIKLDPDSLKRRLRPGMSVRVSVALDGR